MRADLRAAANTLFGNSSDPPNLTWPYFPDAGAMWEKKEELEERAKRLASDPAHQAKLKAARLKHFEEMKAKRGR